MGTGTSEKTARAGRPDPAEPAGHWHFEGAPASGAISLISRHCPVPAAGGRGTGAFSGPAVALPRARARPQTSRLSRHFITSSAGQ